MPDLILALDVSTRDEALRITTTCRDSIDAVKIGYPLVLRAGLGIAREIAGAGLPVIADFKVADIPNTNRLICEAVFAAGCTGVICHGFPGGDSLAACTAAARKAGGDCYVVAEMSHPGGADFFGGRTGEAIARLAVEHRATGIVAPGTRPGRVRELRGIVGSLRILSPGIGVQGGDAAAIRGLVDGIIVGRAIYGADDPASAAREYAASCQ